MQNFRMLIIKWGFVLGLAVLQGCAQTELSEPRYMPAQTSWTAVPEQAPVTEGYLDVGGARLWYWDTGGDGEPVVFSHPASGSALVWSYQQPVLVEAGYRVIAYSRRGHYRSEVLSEDSPGTGVNDLYQLVEHLGVDKFHLVGFALGADVLPDFAISYPERLLSLSIGCTIGRPGDPAYRDSDVTLMPEEFRRLPAWLKELSPAYRAANPSGAEEWRKLNAVATPNRQPVPAENEVTPEKIAQIEAPTLLFTGDADLYMPPSRLWAYAEYWSDPEVVLFTEAGHSVYWEQPDAFNQVLLDFLQRHSQR
jgi:pimeloyl-ACP methyl ester carboxylesterase